MEQLISKKSFRSTENILIPVTITGLIVSNSKSFGEKPQSDFKIICANAIEYLIDANSECRDVLPLYMQNEVKIIGLLNTATKAIIAQRILPKGSTDDREKIIDSAARKSRNLIKKLTQSATSLEALPTAT